MRTVELCVYDGKKPKDFNPAKESAGHLLCKFVDEKPTLILDDGEANYFIAFMDGQPICSGNIATSGLSNWQKLKNIFKEHRKKERVIIVPCKEFFKGNYFTLDIWPSFF